jgi:WS/DGAT/MGAT family acyltransferase
MTETAENPQPIDTMSGADALLWTIGADPVMRPTIVALMVLSGPPDWAELRSRIAGLTQSVPRLRCRAAARPPGRGRPRFVEDPGFELASHLRRIRLPEDSGLRDVLDLAQTMATSGFDPTLPLWEATLVEGLDDGRAALLIKVHHALIDGVGGLAVLAQLFDPIGPPPKARRPRKGGAVPVTHPRDLPQAVTLVDTVADATRAAVLHPVRTLGQLAAVTTSVARLMMPAGKPLSPIMTGRGFRRHVEVIDLELGTLKDAARAWGGTVNDVFVSSVIRGMTLYHSQHGVMSAGFRALMPVNVRDGDETGSGNHFVPARFIIPVHPDVADCIAEVRRIADSWKHAPGLAMSDVLATGLSALPAGVARGLWGSMLLGDDFCITNVPGPPFHAAIAGSGVEHIYAFSPPSGAAFNVSLVSAGDRACIAVTVDVDAVPDSAKLAGCIEDGFAEVCAARPPFTPAAP